MENLLNDFNKGTTECSQELGEQSLEYMKAQYSKETNNMHKHISNLNVQPIKENYKNGFVLSSGNDEVAIYNELGTGIVGQGTGILADEVNYQYNIGIYKGTPPEGAIKEYGQEYCDRVTTSDTWWYHKNNKWWHTEGMRGKNMYAGLVDKLKISAPKKYNTMVKAVIENYNSKN